MLREPIISISPIDVQNAAPDSFELPGPITKEFLQEVADATYTNLCNSSENFWEVYSQALKEAIEQVVNDLEE